MDLREGTEDACEMAYLLAVAAGDAVDVVEGAADVVDVVAVVEEELAR